MADDGEQIKSTEETLLLSFSVKYPRRSTFEVAPIPQDSADRRGVVSGVSDCGSIQTTNVLCSSQPDPPLKTAGRFVSVFLEAPPSARRKLEDGDKRFNPDCGSTSSPSLRREDGEPSQPVEALKEPHRHRDSSRVDRSRRAIGWPCGSTSRSRVRRPGHNSPVQGGRILHRKVTVSMCCTLSVPAWHRHEAASVRGSDFFMLRDRFEQNESLFDRIIDEGSAHPCNDYWDGNLDHPSLVQSICSAFASSRALDWRLLIER